MSTHFEIKKRQTAITLVNAYYEIKKEGNNQEDMKQFKKNFVKFIVQYMDNAYFTEEIAKRLFLSIITLEDEHEKDYTVKQWKCANYYKFSYREIGHLFLSVRNYYYLNGIKSINFEPTKELINLMSECDWVIEENDCYVCNWHGYDVDWPNSDERGKFYYSIPGNINHPLCESCVKTNCLDIKTQINDAADDDESEIYGTVAYLRKHDLIKCENCGNIWDGCAQCNCWQWNDYGERTDEIDADEIGPNEIGPYEIDPYEIIIIRENVSVRSPPPDRPVPLPRDKKIMGLEEKIALLEEENKNLLEEIRHLKNLVNNS
jgi:hypothetical protein